MEGQKSKEVFRRKRQLCHMSNKTGSTSWIWPVGRDWDSISGLMGMGARPKGLGSEWETRRKDRGPEACLKKEGGNNEGNSKGTQG